jgi:hypothetical protein
MTLSEEVRAHCAQVVADARWVRIDLDRAGAVEAGPPPQLDPARHYLEGSREDVATFIVALTAINFGSGWFPTLRKREGMSGYFTVASSLTDRFRAAGPWTNAQLRALTAVEVAATLGQPPDHELMALYAQALRGLGTFLGDRTALEVVEAAGGTAQALAATFAREVPMFNDAGFHKRAQILPNDLALAGVAEFADLDTLTIFADNLVPHVLRCDGVLVYDDALAGRIDAEELVDDARQEREIRASAVVACAHIAAALGVSERTLDMWLWTRGQDPAYKARPRHRSRSVFY